MGKSGSCISSSLPSCRAHFPLKTIFKHPAASRSLPSQPRLPGSHPCPSARPRGCGGGHPEPRRPACPSAVNWANEGCCRSLQSRHRWVTLPTATAGWTALWDIPEPGRPWEGGRGALTGSVGPQGRAGARGDRPPEGALIAGGCREPAQGGLGLVSPTTSPAKPCPGDVALKPKDRTVPRGWERPRFSPANQD